MCSFFFLGSCKQNGNITVSINEFPKTLNLSHKKIKVASNLYTPVGLSLLDSVAVVLDLKSDTLFQVFRLPGFDRIGGFISRGQGPDEEYFVDPFIQRLPGNVVMYRSGSTVRKLSFNMLNQNFEFIDDIELPASLLDLFHIIELNDGVIVGVKTDGQTEREFVSYNKRSKEIKDFGVDYPVVNKDITISEEFKNMVFAKALTAKPDKKLFACVYDKFPILRIYSNRGELKKEVRLNNGQSFPYALIESNPTIKSINDIMQNYRMIKSTDRFIYALYMGKKSGDVSPGLNDFSNTIHVWDWDGNPIAELKLDHQIFTFDVDKDDHGLVASSLESLNVLYKYVLEDLL